MAHIAIMSMLYESIGIVSINGVFLLGFFLASIVLINQYVTENKLLLFENAALFTHFLTFSEKENLEFSRRYRAGALEYSFHYRAVFLHS